MRYQKLKFAYIVVPVVALYLIYKFATYVLEGSIHLLQRPDPIGRFTYAIIANMLIGTILLFLSKDSRDRLNSISYKKTKERE